MARYFTGVPADDPHVQAMMALDAFMTGDNARAEELARGIGDRPDALGSHASMILAALDRVGSPQGYRTAVARYVSASECSGEHCADVVAQATTALGDACLVAGPGTTGCGAVVGDLGDRPRLIAAGLVLLADGHRSAASTRVTDALAMPLDGAPSCAEVAALRAWGNAPSVPTDLVQPIADATRAAARDASDCALFAESP